MTSDFRIESAYFPASSFAVKHLAVVSAKIQLIRLYLLLKLFEEAV